MWLKGKKNVKVPALRQIANAISKIASPFESHSTVVNNLVVPSSSISEVMTKIRNMEAITGNSNWHARCCELMLEKPKREMFVALKGNDQSLLDWLKFATGRIKD